MKSLKVLYVSMAAFFVVMLLPGRLLAAPYSSNIYGQCNYSEGCAPPVVLPPDDPPPVPSPDSVSRDVDSDGNSETATDVNGDATDGYESFGDADSSSEVLTPIDGDDDGKIDFVLSTDSDDFPERYWDPDNDVLSTVQLVDCDSDETAEWRFEVGDETRTYDPDTDSFITDCRAPSQPNTNPGSTGPDKKNNGPGKDNRLTGILPLISNNPVYQAVGEVIKRIPAPVAYGFPYVLLLVLLLLALRLIWQSKHELNRLLIAAETLEVEKQLNLEKENFVRLSSHYLRTPITVMRGNIELMQSLKQISDDVAKTLNLAGQLLLDHVSSLLDNLGEQKLASIKPAQQSIGWRTVVTPYFMLPIVGVLGLLTIGHLLFIDFRVTSPRIVDFLVQIALAILVIQLLVSKLRQRRLNQQNRIDQERVLEEQRALDNARSTFISDAANKLQAQLDQFKLQLGDIANKPEAAKVNSALKELGAMVAKFRLVAYLQSGQLEASKANFDLKQLVDEALQPYDKSAQLRGIRLEENVQSSEMYQQRQLLGIIIGSLVDNSLKFSSDGTIIEVDAKHENDHAVITVHDQGQGIPKDKQDLLFKPFSRTDSTETFNTEGLGFSLYLDKVIAHYLKGDISINSTEGEGTTVTVTVPA